MGKESVRVIVDDREPEEFIAAISNHDEVEDWYVERLDVGDIQFERSPAIIERKSPGDYNNSLTSGHVKSQARRMAEATDNAAILIEGDLHEVTGFERSSIGGESIRGSMASIMVRQSVPVVPCSSRGDLIDLAVRIGRKAIEDPGAPIINTGMAESGDPFVVRALACVDGVGSKTAFDIYEHYETVPEVIEAELEELQDIDGIGPRTARKIKNEFEGK